MSLCMKYGNRVMALFMVFTFAFCNLGAPNVSAAKKPKLSKTSVNVNVGASVKLKVKNGKGTWKWSTSNKKVATVKKGKVIGIKAGTAVITAKKGKTKLTCKVKVTENSATNVKKLVFDDIPEDEYERAIWYGFVPDNLNGLNPDKTVITWKGMCTMLRNMLAKYDNSVLSDWDKQIKGAPNTKMKRDGGAIAVLFAARELDIDYYNICNNPDDFEYDWGSNSTRDYPVFDWNKHYALVDDDNNHAGSNDALYGAYTYCTARRISLVNGQPLMDKVKGSPALNLDMTLRMAAVATVRLYESEDRTATECAESMLKKVLKTEEGKMIVASAEARKREIRSSETKIVKSDKYIQGETYTGTAYYISNSGNDANDGKSPENAWATIDRLITAGLKYGDAVFFERGSLWREAVLPRSVADINGITYSAYGTGDKPKFYGSPENGAGAYKWELTYQGANGEKIWKFKSKLPDTSAVVMNDGEDYAKREYPYWNGEQYLSADDFKTPYDMRNELSDKEFFIDLPYDKNPIDATKISVLAFDGNYYSYIKGDLYLRYDKGNPGELFNSIEFATLHQFYDGAEKITIDNLNISYQYPPCGGNQMSKEGSVPNSYVTMQNSEFGWGGGCVRYFYLNGDYGAAAEFREQLYGDDGSDDKYGYCFADGGALNVNGSHERIINNYCHHQFQDGIIFETMASVNEDCVDDIFKGNLSEYCVMNLGIMNWDENPRDNHLIKNIKAEDNMVLYCGFESLYNFKTIKSREGGTSTTNFHFDDTEAFWMPRINKHDGSLSVKNNVFAFSTSQLIKLWAYTDEYVHVLDNNTYAQLPGFTFLSKIDYPMRDNFKIEYYVDPKETNEKFIQDKNATIITFDCRDEFPLDYKSKSKYNLLLRYLIRMEFCYEYFYNAFINRS